MLRLKLQYFGHLMQTTDSFEKTLTLGKIEGRRRGRQRIRWLDGITNPMDMSLSKLWQLMKDRQGSLVCYSPWNPEEPDTTWPTEQQKCRGSIMASIKDKDIQTSVLKQK